MGTETSAPALIAIDWGSSNLRVALLDHQGELLARRESPAGVFTLQDGGFAVALLPLCADWLAQHRLPMLACGMIGSRQGIVEVPYLPCPADANDLAAGLVRTDLRTHTSMPQTLFIVPGLTTGSSEIGWDVMRGEETQIFGIPAHAGQLFLLPGTHSKWIVRDGDGRIQTFQTYMTGELYELLLRHSSLARVMEASQPSTDAFRLGVSEARDDALENLLFRVRTAGLLGRLAPSALADYLSGLLIGAEVKAGLHRFADAASREPIAVIGNAQLTQRYASTLTLFGLTAHEFSGDAVFSGLLSIARAADLIKEP